MSEDPRVRLDATAAEGAVAFLRALEGGAARADLAARWTALANHPAYHEWAAFNGLGPGVLAELQRAMPGDGESTPPASEEVRGIVAAFADNRARLDELSARLELATALPVREAAVRALTALPAGTILESTVFVLLSGDRQAVETEAGQVLIDLQVIPRPSSGARRYLGDLLAHELHHNGLDWCRQRDAEAQRLTAKGPLSAAVVHLLHMLLSEGTANALFTPAQGDWLAGAAQVMADIYGQGVVDEYLNCLPRDRQRIPQLFDELDGALHTLLSPAASADAQAKAREYASKIAWQREGMARPVAHFLGEVMVSAIRRQAGERAVVAAIGDLRRFIPAYQAAARVEGLPTLRPETAEALDALWSA